MTRYLTQLTWQEVADLPKDPGIVIQPIGATEQHGHHLPLATDTLIAEAVIKEALKYLPNDIPAWVLPTIPISKSNEHIGYAGTIALKASTLLAVLTDIASSVAQAGFRRLLLVNAHGGNKALLEMLARDLRAALGLLTFVASPNPLTAEDSAALSPQERRFGIHGGAVETALILASNPELVKMDKAAPFYPDFPSATLNLTTQPMVAWLTRDWSPVGHFGDPTAATAEDGARYLEHAGRALAAVIAEMATFEVAHG
jgi:creatinine amidohydrolase/Fe(II)-dependent formamide hydrolase-like protein